jgi:hypothetical protein
MIRAASHFAESKACPELAEGALHSSRAGSIGFDSAPIGTISERGQGWLLPPRGDDADHDASRPRMIKPPRSEREKVVERDELTVV